jgi:hypothetical protein
MMSFRGRDLAGGLLWTLGVVLSAIAWARGEDTDVGFFFVVMSLIFWSDSRHETEMGELRYRIGELEYKIEQAERSRRRTTVSEAS